MNMPAVGRIVHYVDGRECRAAVVTEVPAAKDPVEDLQCVALAVLNPTGMFFARDVAYHDGSGHPADPGCRNPHEGGPHRYCPCGWAGPSLRGGTWHWPRAGVSAP